MPITITTWQSIYKLEKTWYSDFDVVIGDEAHLFKSKSLVDIMTKLLDCKYRFGFTGTLDGTQTHKWILEGLFGPSYKVTKTKELIDKGHISKQIPLFDDDNLTFKPPKNLSENAFVKALSNLTPSMEDITFQSKSVKTPLDVHKTLVTPF